MFVKDWFFKKICADHHNLHLFNSDFSVVKETPKAVLLAIEYVSLDGERDGVVHVWCPKSCTMTAEEARAEEEARLEMLKASEEAYMALVDFAKANGIKGVRVGLKAATIRAKLAAAGIQY